MPKLLDHRGQPLAPPPVRPPRAVQARFDAAQTSDENKNHWANADGYSARSANNFEVRRVLRNRARYEIANNSYAKGIVETKANDTIGTGPRLQVRTADLAFNRRISDEFDGWAAEIGLAEKLRTLCKAKIGDGEGFARFTTNPRLNSPVQLDLRLIEADQVTTPFPWPIGPRLVDGMTLDEQGYPESYNILRGHPGDFFSWGFPYEYDVFPARDVVHWFRVDRPDQYRGIPDITPALPLFAQLRRFTLATLAAAETAADFAALLYSEMPPDGTAVDGEPFESLEIVKRMMTTLPAGWKMAQLKAEHPATTYQMFVAAILQEIARCLNMPFNIAAGNSAGYNYSSGRLDHQTYFKSIEVEQYHIECAGLGRLFAAWLAEARLATDLIPARLVGVPPHQWFWDGHEHVDPVKEATAEQIRLASGTTTLAAIYASQGLDWRDPIQQRAEEVALMRQLGLPVLGATPAPVNATHAAALAAAFVDDDEPSPDPEAVRRWPA